MTITFAPRGNTPVDLLAHSEEWLREAAQKLADTVEAIKAGDFGQEKQAIDSIKSLKQAVFMAIEEGNRVEKLRKQVAGSAGSGAFDLDAARDEIRRRLARLRDAGAG